MVGVRLCEPERGVPITVADGFPPPKPFGGVVGRCVDGSAGSSFQRAVLFREGDDIAAMYGGVAERRSSK